MTDEKEHDWHGAAFDRLFLLYEILLDLAIVICLVLSFSFVHILLDLMHEQMPNMFTLKIFEYQLTYSDVSGYGDFGMFALYTIKQFWKAYKWM